MQLNLNDPSSIIQWWRVFPERHGPQLAAIERLDSERAPAIRRAYAQIAADPALAPLLELGTRRSWPSAKLDPAHDPAMEDMDDIPRSDYALASLGA